MKVVHFLGYKGGGKTRAISYFARELTRRGRRIGTLKHIHESGFAVDTRGKDTWVHASSGARLVVVMSPQELAVISKFDTSSMTSAEVMSIFKDKRIDYVLVEGFNKEFSQMEGAFRILCSRSRKDASDLMSRHKGVICIIGKFDDDEDCKSIGGVPVLQLPTDFARLLRLIGEERSSGGR